MLLYKLIQKFQLSRTRHPQMHTLKEAFDDKIWVFINLQNEFVDVIQV